MELRCPEAMTDDSAWRSQPQAIHRAGWEEALEFTNKQAFVDSYDFWLMLRFNRR